jgi:hypothetical protein
MIEDIKFHRNKKQARLGSLEEYQEVINIEKNINKNNKGFWSQARLVNKNLYKEDK